MNNQQVEKYYVVPGLERPTIVKAAFLKSGTLVPLWRIVEIIEICFQGSLIPPLGAAISNGEFENMAFDTLLDAAMCIFTANNRRVERLNQAIDVIEKVSDDLRGVLCDRRIEWLLKMDASVSNE